MKRAELLAKIVIVLSFIPIVIGKINSTPAKPKNASEYEFVSLSSTEVETASISFIPYYEYSFMGPVIDETTAIEETSEIETETEFWGYSFIPLSVEEQRTIKVICDKYEIAYELMLAIAKQESNYNMSAHNPVSDDWGMFQVNVKTWDNIAISLGLAEYRTDLAQNTEMACYIVNYCLSLANGDLRIALNYYRTGTPNAKYEAGSDYATIILNNLYEIESNK